MAPCEPLRGVHGIDALRRYLPERLAPNVSADNPPGGDSGGIQGVPKLAAVGGLVISEELPSGFRRLGGPSGALSTGTLLPTQCPRVLQAFGRRPEAAALRTRSLGTSEGWPCTRYHPREHRSIINRCAAVSFAPPTADAAYHRFRPRPKGGRQNCLPSARFRFWLVTAV